MLHINNHFTIVSSCEFYSLEINMEDVV